MARLSCGLMIGLLLAAMPLARADDFFSTAPRFGPDEARNYYWKPIASFLLPGFDQWVERQWGPAAVYSGIGAAGAGLAGHAASSVDKDRYEQDNLEDYDDAERRYAYGLQLYTLAGELSAFHSFRTAVRTRRADGEFTFLRTEESSADLLSAPFDFSQLKRPTVYVPLLLLAGAGIADLAGGGDHRAFRAGDAAFSGGVAYNAGVGEEALFRGYLMPVLREGTGSDLVANSVASLAFGLGHVSSNNPYPVFQALFGFYLGTLVQRDDWSLRQAVFLHAWWDVMAIGFELADRRSDGYIPLPGIVMQF
jgi:hypothetical protein